MHKEHATVRETKKGWLWCEMGNYFKNAVNANKAIMRRNKNIAKSTGASAVIVDWIPNTKLGFIIVNSLNVP
jgi:hypothetical protein